MAKWTTKDIPNQTGRIALVTGANSGLGYESALELARKGATVVMAARDKAKNAEAADKIRQSVPNAKLELMTLDLASLTSVRKFAADFKARFDRLDLLLNNAGVMAIPRRETEDGFETQLAVNFLGHFALTGLLLNTLLATPNSRVVTTSSMLHLRGRIDFDDLQGRTKYNRQGAYSQSKLADLYLAFELQRRLEAVGAQTISLSAHPGYAATNLQAVSAHSIPERIMLPILNATMAQSAAKGALPQLQAATDPNATGGQYYGPRFFFRGSPRVTKAKASAYDTAIAARLWQTAEELTGVRYDFSPAKVPVSSR